MKFQVKAERNQVITGNSILNSHLLVSEHSLGTNPIIHNLPNSNYSGLIYTPEKGTLYQEGGDT